MHSESKNLIQYRQHCIDRLQIIISIYLTHRTVPSTLSSMRSNRDDHSFLKDLIKQMTFEEKVSLLCGSSFWETAGIDRLSIPRMKLTDGPSGARGEDFNSGVSSACFPAGVALAASFNESLVREVGKALAQETQTKGARVL
jgi:beta-glucosidase-like glycosyl hydrolase